MLEVLKNAASLIAAYRKQNVIARRLSLTNRDKFMQCADMAAQTFVETHGGSVDAVMHDRELVKEFALQQHLAIRCNVKPAEDGEGDQP